MGETGWPILFSREARCASSETLVHTSFPKFIQLYPIAGRTLVLPEIPTVARVFAGGDSSGRRRIISFLPEPDGAVPSNTRSEFSTF